MTNEFPSTNEENLDVASLLTAFKHIGLVVTISDGIVTITGISDVGYMKRLTY